MPRIPASQISPNPVEKVPPRPKLQVALQDRQAFSVEEFAARMGLSRSTAYRMASKGLLKLHKIGRRTVVLRSEETRLLGELDEPLQGAAR